MSTAYFHGYISDNLIALQQEAELSKQDIEQLSRNAFNIAWLSQTEKDNYDSKIATGYIPVEDNALYMHAVIPNAKSLFKELNEQYNADIFVFITQMEIKTNYKTCLDIANKIYRREVMLHFSVYDINGNLLAAASGT